MFEIDLSTEIYLGITTNVIALFLLIMVIVFCLRTIAIKSKKNFNFYLLFGVSFIEILTHLFTTVIQKNGFFGNNKFGVVMYSLVFTENCIYLIAWLHYLAIKFSKKQENEKKFVVKMLLFAAPLIALFLMSIVNMFTPVFFSYINDVYDRKALYDLTLLVPLCYLIVGIILFLKNNNKKAIYLEIPFIELLIPVVIAHILESLFVGLCVIPLGNVICLMILVFNNMQQNISIDKLTSLYTRKELFEYLDGLESSNNQKYKVYGIMFDLDDFKSINDTYGHLIGDEALREFGYIVRSNLNSKSIGFRYAGDEFVIIVKANDESQALEIANNILKALDNANVKKERVYNLQASYGLTSLDASESVAKFVERMDLKMYENKTSRKYTRKRNNINLSSE